MTRLRLIPVVIFAASSLLLIKAMTIFSGGDRSIRPMTVVATEAPRAMETNDNAPEYTSAMPAKETKKEEPKKDGPKDPPPAPPKAPETPPGINVGVPGDPSPAQRALLERLQQRREELDIKARDLELRENLMKEAEQRLEAKLNELKMLEASGNDKPVDNDRMKSLVIMYEGMKPKDAARIFDKLDMKVLVEVARAMKPAKLSDVLAVMAVEPAQRLTIELARGLSPDRATPPGDLQRVNVPPPAPKQQPKQQTAVPR